MERSHRCAWILFDEKDDADVSSAEHVPQTISTMSLDSVAHALPPAELKINTSIYTSRDPVRQSSLNDVSESLTLKGHEMNGHGQNLGIDRPGSAASFQSTSSKTPNAGSRSQTPVNGVRRKPPAPPSKKYSTSSMSATSNASSDDLNGSGSFGGESELLQEGARGVPPPIIEVQAPQGEERDYRPEGWITFTA
jgi:hypothetical protein